MFVSPKKLAAEGILGMNKRNADFVMRYNKRRYYPLVDDKLRTKKLAQEHNIAVPELYGVVSEPHDIKRLPEHLKKHKGFVMKPAHGAGGEGVVVITHQLGDSYVKSSGAVISAEALQHHAQNILTGMYSLGGLPDKGMIEYLVQFDPLLSSVSYQGVPDIRVIVFLGVPVAAMVRLPTRDSDGKANLHQGAVGVGIEIATGLTARGVRKNSLVTIHPDTHNSLEGIQMPHWPQILELSAKCADLCHLGYLGVDIVLDGELGPLVLELNARPGLNVQLANGFGLEHRLRKLEKMEKAIPESAKARAAMAANPSFFANM